MDDYDKWIVQDACNETIVLGVFEMVVSGCLVGDLTTKYGVGKILMENQDLR